MNVVEPGSPAENMVRRVMRVLLRPEETWDVIQAEDSTIEGLYRGWVFPLAAIPAVCGALGQLGFGGIHLFGIYYHRSFVGIFARAAVSYALTLAWVFVLAVVIDELALQFGGERSRTQAFKLTAYSGTAAWVAGVFGLLPGIGGLLALLGGLYSIYLLYLGLPRLMRSDPERTSTYFVLILVVALMLALVMGALTSEVTNFGGPISIY